MIPTRKEHTGSQIASNHSDNINIEIITFLKEVLSMAKLERGRSVSNTAHARKKLHEILLA